MDLITHFHHQCKGRISKKVWNYELPLNTVVEELSDAENVSTIRTDKNENNGNMGVGNSGSTTNYSYQQNK